MLARILAVALCLSITSQCSVETGGWIELVFVMEAFLAYPTLCFKGIQVSGKIRVLSCGTSS